MRQILITILATLTMVFFSACGYTGGEKTTEQTTKVAENQAATPANKILVAYFSCTGNTKKAALEVAEILKADTFEIVPAEPYTPDDLNYNVDNCRANVEQKNSDARPEIKSKLENPAQYKTIVIAFPIWWGAEPRIIDTFIESYDLTGKTIVPVCTSNGSEIQASVKNLQTLCNGATVKDGKRLGIISKDEVKTWLHSLNL